MGALVCYETSANKHQHTLCNNPEKRGSPPLRDGSLKSSAVRQFVCSDSKRHLLYLQATILKRCILVVSHVTLNNSCSSYSVNSYRQYDPHIPSNINLQQPGYLYLCFIRSQNWATLTGSIIAFLMSSMICVWQKKKYRSTRSVWFVAHSACASALVRAFRKWIYVTALLYIPYSYMEKWRFSSTHS